MIDFGSANIPIYGLGTAAVIGLITMLVSKFMTKSSEKRKFEHAQHQEKQEKIQEEIKVINKKQEVLTQQIEATEKAAEKSKAKVDNIVKKATQEISEVLKEDDLVKIDKTIQEGWDDL